MNKWQIQGDSFTDGDQTVGIELVRSMILSDDPLRVHADQMGISMEHFVNLALEACRVLEIPVPRRQQLEKISVAQKERAPQP